MEIYIKQGWMESGETVVHGHGSYKEVTYS